MSGGHLKPVFCGHLPSVLTFNLTDGVYVNQSAAFSDYHGTGLNPAANASYCDAAFVARRFAVVQRRWHVKE